MHQSYQFGAERGQTSESVRSSSYRIFDKELRFSRLLLCALAIASHLSFARNDKVCSCLIWELSEKLVLDKELRLFYHKS